MNPDDLIPKDILKDINELEQGNIEGARVIILDIIEQSIDVLVRERIFEQIPNRVRRT